MISHDKPLDLGAPHFQTNPYGFLVGTLVNTKTVCKRMFMPPQKYDMLYTYIYIYIIKVLIHPQILNHLAWKQEDAVVGLPAQCLQARALFHITEAEEFAANHRFRLCWKSPTNSNKLGWRGKYCLPTIYHHISGLFFQLRWKGTMISMMNYGFPWIPRRTTAIDGFFERIAWRLRCFPGRPWRLPWQWRATSPCGGHALEPQRMPWWYHHVTILIYIYISPYLC